MAGELEPTEARPYPPYELDSLDTSFELLRENGFTTTTIDTSLAWMQDWEGTMALLEEREPAIFEYETMADILTATKKLAARSCQVPTYEDGQTMLEFNFCVDVLMSGRLAELGYDDAEAVVRGKQARIVIDWAQLDTVIGTLFKQYQEQGYPYNRHDAIVPHDYRHLSEKMPIGGLEHAMYLWNLCYYMRGGMKSNDAAKLLSALYDAHPDLFDVEKILEWEEGVLAKTLEMHQLGYRYNQIAGFWIENARRLKERWQSDPRKIFDGVSDYAESLERIQNKPDGSGFQGFQKKMVSMVTYYLMDEHMIDYYVFPLPVDFHVMRVTLSNEIVKLPNKRYREGIQLENSGLEDLIRDLYYDYAVRHQVDPLELCSAIWLQSMVSCGKNPGNQMREPEGRNNRKGRSTKLELIEPNPHNALHARKYVESCESCSLKPTCKHNIPSKTYYIWGEPMLTGPRQDFPPSTLFKLNEVAVRQPKGRIHVKTKPKQRSDSNDYQQTSLDMQ